MDTDEYRWERKKAEEKNLTEGNGNEAGLGLENAMKRVDYRNERLDADVD
jgi:hypothetical protein